MRVWSGLFKCIYNLSGCFGGIECSVLINHEHVPWNPQLSSHYRESAQQGAGFFAGFWFQESGIGREPATSALVDVANEMEIRTHDCDSIFE